MNKEKDKNMNCRSKNRSKSRMPRDTIARQHSVRKMFFKTQIETIIDNLGER